MFTTVAVCNSIIPEALMPLEQLNELFHLLLIQKHIVYPQHHCC